MLTSRALFEKDCNANLKGPREGQSIRHSASNQRSYPSVWGRLSILEAWVRREAQQCIRELKFGMNSGNVQASYHVTYLPWEPKLSMHFSRLFFHVRKRGWARDYSLCMYVRAVWDWGSMSKYSSHRHRNLLKVEGGHRHS